MNRKKLLLPTSRTKVRALPQRGCYNLQSIYEILDEGFICHIGFKSDEQPFVIPVVYGRKDNKIYFHGGKGRRLFKTIKRGIEICITVTLVDGLVLAKSAFHHSINYRSVLIFGKAEELYDKKDKLDGLEIIMEHLLPGRWNDVRIPNETEINATTVLAVNLNETSAKIRTGPPVDEYNDLELNIWSGVIPLKLKAECQIPFDTYGKNINTPGYINSYIKKHN